MYKNRLKRLKTLQDYMAGNKYKVDFNDIKEHLVKQGYEIEDRMLRNDIKCLKENIIFTYDGYSSSSKKEEYSKIEMPRIPSVFNLSDDVQYTLSVIVGLVDSQKSYSGLEKITDILNHSTENIKVEYSGVFKFRGMQLVGGINPPNEKLKKLFNSIRDRKLISFYGIPYEFYSEPAKKVEFIVYPLQIQVLENRHFLIALDKTWDGGKFDSYLRVFPIDQMNDEIKYSSEEGVRRLSFQRKKIVEEIDSYFENCIGLYRNDSKYGQPINIHLEFSGWAADYMRPIVNSKKITNSTVGGFQTYFQLRDTPELELYLSRFGSNCKRLK
jgi:hypothetical protein